MVEIDGGDERRRAAEPAAGPSSPYPEWSRRCRGEPSLEELLADPIMHLLWRRDRLDPHAARLRIGALRLLLRRVKVERAGRDPPPWHGDGQTQLHAVGLPAVR